MNLNCHAAVKRRMRKPGVAAIELAEAASTNLKQAARISELMRSTIGLTALVRDQNCVLKPTAKPSGNS